MRAKRAPQRSFFDVGYPNHGMGRALERISTLLDGHPEFLDWIAADVDRGCRSRRGRAGLPCEVILRCGILKQLWQVDYRDLEFALLDSASAKYFARAEVWEKINRVLMDTARGGGVEGGRTVRIDSTVTETHIRKPTDSQLLCDGVRVLTRLLVHARDELGAEAFPFHNHRRAAKRWALRASRRREKRRRAAYRELLRIARRTLGYVHGALAAADEREAPALRDWRAKALQYGELLGRVVDQAERRVLRGERVPAQEKVASLFEPHTDIIVKGGREVQYGHKVNLSTGASGLVLDAVADSRAFRSLIPFHSDH